MAPIRSANRRAQRDHSQQQSITQPDPNHDPSQDIFIDPMMGTALQIYVEKDVEDRDTIVELIVVCRIFLAKRRIHRVNAHKCGTICMSLSMTRLGTRLGHTLRSRGMLTLFLQTHGGIVSPGYSGVPYILGTCLHSSRARDC